MDYAPDSDPDVAFYNIDVDVTVVCCVHKAKPEIYLAFEETSMGKRFYACSVHNVIFLYV